MSKDITYHDMHITRDDRLKQYYDKRVENKVIWFTGLSGSGKSTIANALEIELHTKGYPTYLLDGDNVRHGLNKDLGFSTDDRAENIRRIGETAKLFYDAGLFVLVSFISPLERDRQRARSLIQPNSNFIEVHLNTSLEVCEERDTKGLYHKARAGDLKDFTGIDSPYEQPKSADIILDTNILSLDDCVKKIIDIVNK